MLFSCAKAPLTNCIAYPTVGHAKVDRNIRWRGVGSENFSDPEGNILKNIFTRCYVKAGNKK